MKKTYHIELDGMKIGTTQFESADTPMGVVYGKLNFENINSPYELIKQYCLKNKVGINNDYPEDKFINTMIIPELKVFDSERKELKGLGAYIIGMESEEFEIQFGGITSDLMQSEFKHHYDQYYKAE
ncbi:hypothetical protein QVZ41_14265 [Wenyingzhuangia sp. chi5]|uniref:Uncharacterized protein n=1 Tax=Wenyingzhuangia gilva TaxID=3057677 RepID=A0ABT8VVK9_9FLAO|nr:hypothetical protein [Wenyingzhuangia sp. chi5]MDO3696013.1 hypothetical protein [Wenyingzhuangia sp. chi5]